MLYTYPDYYQEFVCTADQCEDTCCAGWQIMIDERSLRKYEKVQGEFATRLQQQIDWKEKCFRQSEDRRCAFLNDKNLCDLYLSLGETGFCKTCKTYPRHIEEFENEREVSLSLSCPEVAKILMGRKTPVQFLQKENDKEEEYEYFDLFLYSKLQDARACMLRILQDRDTPIEMRACAILGLSHDMQARIDRGELFACDELFERYTGEKAREHIGQLVTFWREKQEEQYAFASENFHKLYRLEHLDQSWQDQLLEAEAILYIDDPWNYYHLYTAFQVWMAENYREWEIQAENLLVYFIFTYFCGAVYDGRVFAKVQMAVVSTYLIHDLLLARWLKNGGQIDLEDVVEVVYRYSREVEHSDLNLECMEKMMEEDPLISKKRKL